MKKRIIIISSIFVIVVLFGLSFLGYNGDIILSDDTMKKISQIRWDDPENLKNIGFKIDENGEYWLDVYDLACDGGTISYLSVSKAEEIPDKLKQYENYSYTFTESTMGKFDIRRYVTSHAYSYRRYNVYIDDIVIHLREDSLEGYDYAFEEAINIIYQRQQNN